MPENDTFENVPDIISWQGEDLVLHSIVRFAGRYQAHNLNGMIRFSFANARGDVKLMQFQFPNNPVIDWQALEDANKLASEPTKRALRLSKKAIYERQWYAKNKRRLVRVLSATGKPSRRLRKSQS